MHIVDVFCLESRFLRIYTLPHPCFDLYRRRASTHTNIIINLKCASNGRRVANNYAHRCSVQIMVDEFAFKPFQSALSRNGIV